MLKARGLGKGLDALFTSAQPVANAPETILTLPIKALRPGKFQPRTRMDEEAITELSESIRSQGVIQPLIVRLLVSGEHEIIAGERRWRAAQKAGLDRVPVVVKEIDDKAAIAISLIENIQREDLNAIDEALGIKRLTEEFNMTHEAVAKILGKSRSAVTNLQRLLLLTPQVQQMLREQKLEMGHARSLLGADSARQLDLAKRIIALDLTVREAESLVGSVSARSARPTTRKSGELSADKDTINLQERLAEKLGIPVRIHHSKKGAGKITLSYASLDQLDTLLAKLQS
ncbi:MAG: ParB/RepB/Spo0J family partition protein [Proteobacteria bacterium]|nr:ParB/RepB/Spo0J family partition protein [Pseudomonadota bacterium]